MKIALVYLNEDKLVSRGVGYIAASVTEAGHDLTFFDNAYTTVLEIAARVLQEKYDVLLISSTTLYYARVVELVQAVKLGDSEVVTVLGGLHATIMRDEILQECDELDYLCVGEGEEFVVELLQALDRNDSVSEIQNLGYRSANNAVVINAVRPCTDLTTLKPFKHELFRHTSVVRSGELLPGFTYVAATRGCPYNCTYCCNSYNLALYKSSYLRTQNPDTVIEELLDLKVKYPAKLLYFGDEMILFDEDYVVDLFRRIHREVQLPIGCMVRTETITPRIVELFKEVNCRYVGMGIECGNEKFRREWLNRHMTNQQLIDAFTMLREGVPNIWLTSYNMTGFPVSWDKQLTRETKELNSRIGLDHSQYTQFFPLPGTRLYDYCVEQGFIDWSRGKGVSYFNQSVLNRAKIENSGEATL